MIAAILLGLATPVQAAPPSEARADDIVIVGRRKRQQQLDRLKMITRQDPDTGAMACVFKRRSGDAYVDTTVCEAALACHAMVTDTSVAAMRACLAPTMNMLGNGVPWRTGAVEED